MIDVYHNAAARVGNFISVQYWRGMTARGRGLLQKEGGPNLLTGGIKFVKPFTIIPIIVSTEADEGYYVSVPIPKYTAKVLVPKAVVSKYKNLEIGDLIWLSVQKVTPNHVTLEFPALKSHKKLLQKWAVNHLVDYISEVSTLQNHRIGDRVPGKKSSKNNKIKLTDGTKANFHQREDEDFQPQKDEDEYEPTEFLVINEDLATRRLHVAWCPEEDGSDTSVGTANKCKSIFACEFYFVAQATNGELCFCPRYLSPTLVEADVAMERLSRDKPHNIVFSHREFNLNFGYLKKTPKNDTSVEETSPNKSQATKTKRKKQKKNSPAKKQKT